VRPLPADNVAHANDSRACPHFTDDAMRGYLGAQADRRILCSI
jgi:hypothetical protein